MGCVRLFKSSDEVCLASTDVENHENMYPIEFLNSIEFPGLSPHILNLKEQMQVMLLRNVNPAQGLYNGTRLLITKLCEWVLQAQIITRSHVGNKVLIPRIIMSSTKSKWPFILKRRQFSIKPCFAMTINKSREKSLNHVGIYLPRPVFCHGRLYVAMSRVTTPEGLKVMMLQMGNQPRNRTKNVVFKEAFNNLSTSIQVLRFISNHVL
ncbi:hypothetical protein V2J09_006136 [Rumex salicifolius]